MEAAIELQRDHDLPEQKLWAAVLHRALLDACGSVGKSESYTRKQINRISENAIKWFTHKQDGFQAVCDFVGLDSDVVRRMAVTLIRESHRKDLIQPARARSRSDMKG
jgi:hypothetical protein